MWHKPLLSLPNQLTYLRILLAPVFYYLFFIESQTAAIWCAVVFTIASLTDWYDGYLARKRGEVSRLGKFLDPLADKILTSAAFFAFFMAGIMSWWMVTIIVIRDISLTSYRIYEEMKGKSIPANLIAKWKTASQIVIIYLVLFAVLYPRIRPEGKILTPFLENFLTSYLLEFLFWGITIYTLFSGLVYLYEDFSLNKKNKA
ncbi:MAG: CDP-diacylglycerol--glycerol-3-phosphate 3-phosphatidyltransferase [Bacteroidetes bacterium]|nr:CDP-diacylglycerol--glycerol-3-phosphate 3-phosphatidyltransferase [Bacteroidota bacterium]